MSTKKLTILSLLTALALIIYVVEAQLPPIVPIPGVKLGLANIVSLFTLFWIGKKEAFIVLILRIFLGTIFTGQGLSFIYSLSGGVFSLVVVLLLFKTFSKKALYIPSIIGGICHNIAQLTCAIFVTSTVALLTYLPVLILSGIITGLFTGLAAQAIINHSYFKTYQLK